MVLQSFFTIIPFSDHYESVSCFQKNKLLNIIVMVLHSFFTIIPFSDHYESVSCFYSLGKDTSKFVPTFSTGFIVAKVLLCRSIKHPHVANDWASNEARKALYYFECSVATHGIRE